MIDIEKENLVTFSEAAKHPAFRSARTGRSAHVSCVFRYASAGARALDGGRIRLEFLKSPGGLRTSREAIARFIRALSTTNSDTPQVASPKNRQKQIDDDESELREAGYRPPIRKRHQVIAR